MVKKELILREELALQRTTMANQTTLLAFVRTALYFLVAGLSLSHLLVLENALYLEIFCFILSGVLFILGLANFFKQKNKIEKSKIHIGDYKMKFLESQFINENKTQDTL